LLVYVLWALLRQQTLVLLHVTPGGLDGLPEAAYELARSRLDDVPV
jgi:hypothetical protein